MDWQIGIFEGGGWNAISGVIMITTRCFRFGDDSTEENRQASAKMLAIALHMLQGTPYIYQGEEIGMTDPHFDSIQQYRDVESRNAYDNLMQQGIDESEVLTILGQKSRDNSRTPIQWTSEKQAGFTSGTPWIDIPNNAEHINVEAAIEDTTSVLHTYRELIKLRHEHDIITYGDIEPMYMEHPQLFIYRRNYDNQTWLVIANFSKETIKLPEDLYSETTIKSGTIENGEISPFGAVVINVQ